MTTSLAKAFREAQTGDVAAGLERYLRGSSALEKVAAGKATRARWLATRARSVLDVGCGTGDMLVELVADAGWERIVGVDHNPDLLATAAERVGGDRRTELVRADATRLPYGDGELGAAVVERTLQHVEDPAAVVAEVARVVAPGGTVLLVEPDWWSLGVASGDPAVTKAVLACVREQIRHPRVGRELRPLLADAGVTDVVVDAEVHETADLGVARFLALIDDGLAALRERGDLPAAALDHWEAELAADAAAGRFSASLVLFVAAGTTPAR
jgi:SAM-dependent methyltransferase